MDILFLLVFLVLMSTFIVGMIKPRLVIRWGSHEKRNRKRVLKFYTPVVFATIIFFGNSVFEKHTQEMTVQGEEIEELHRRFVEVSEANTQTPINIETPDQSGQSTHPDVLYVEEKWNGYHYWMAHTPYTYSDERMENPSLSYSTDGINFKTLDGAVNPIDGPTEEGLHSEGHMSDTDMILKDGKIEMYYRYRHRPKGEMIFRKTSSDGINWTSRELVMEVESTAGDELLSPALLYEDGVYKMWWVGAEGVIYMSASKTGLNGSWAPRKEVELSYSGKELRPWHLDIYKENNQHYLVLNSYDGMEQGNGRVLAIGESVDNGLSFKNIQTIVEPNEDSWDNCDIYRGSIIKVDDVYKLYYSAMHTDLSWGIGLTESSDLINWQGVNFE